MMLIRYCTGHLSLLPCVLSIIQLKDALKYNARGVRLRDNPSMLATVESGAIIGLDAIKISVEVDYNPRAMTGFTIVGLPDAAIQESRERVRSAIKNRG